MSIVKVSRVINASASQVWDVIGDYNNIHLFHPFLESAEQIGEVAKGVGAKRQCNLKNKTSQIEEVVEWVEGKSFVVKAQEAPIVGEVLGGMSVEALGAKKSKVTVDMRYTPKWGMAGQVLNILVFKLIFKLILGRVLKSLKNYMETEQYKVKKSRMVVNN